MAVSDLQLNFEDWMFLGEGNEHVICQHISTLQHSNSDSSSFANASYDLTCTGNSEEHSIGQNCERVPAVPSTVTISPVVDNPNNDSDPPSGNCDQRNQVLRVTKRYCSPQQYVIGEACLSDVIKPWLGSNFSSERTLVTLRGDFFQGWFDLPFWSILLCL